jgi:glycosyltransferase involved in cell wall biosynthesis
VIKLIQNFIRKKLYIIVLKKAAFVFPISGYLIDRLNDDLGLPYNKMLAIPECASSLFLDFQKNKKIQNSNDPNKIIYIGSLGKRRNIKFIIDAFKIVNNQYDNVELHLIGWGEREDDVPLLKEYVIKQKLDLVIKFTKKIAYREMPKILSQYDIGLSLIPPLDIYLLSTPTKCVEYLSLGLPVIANREIHDQRRLVELSNGGILTDYNVEDAAKSIISLLLDENLRNQCCKNGKTWIKNNRTFSKIAKNVFSKICGLETSC